MYVLQRRSPVRGDDCHSSGTVSNMTRLLWSVHVHMVSALYSYGFFLQVDALRTVSTRQNKECLTERIDNGTPAVLQGWEFLILSPRSCIILATKNCLSPKQPGCNNHVTFGLCNVNNVMHKYIHTYMTHTCHLTNYNRMPRLHV